jgi:endonuclease/exonuclease/phosphatase (EEP) superfamily protein YafD
VTVLAGAVGIPTLAASLVAMTQPSQWPAELLVHFKLQYLIASLLCAGMVLMARRWRFGLVMLTAAAVNAMDVAPWGQSAPALTEEGGRPIKLLLANLYHGNGEAHRLADLVRQEDPDLMVALEVTERWSEDLRSSTAGMPHRLVYPRADPFGIALYSRWPLADARLVTLAADLPPGIAARLDLEGGPLTVMAAHPLPPESRAWWEARNRHLSALAEASRSIEGPVILAGDLNVTMWSSHYGLLVRDTNLRDVRRGFGVLPTWPAQLPPAMIPLDHCLVSPELSVEDVRTGPRIGSDHLPLIVSLRL